MTTVATFTPTSCQQTAMDRFADFMRGDRRIFKLAGFAGTGKTTLARHMLDQHFDPRRVAVAAYTNKACSVLRNKGFPQAGTIHNLVKRVMEIESHEVIVTDGERETVPTTEMLWFNKQTHRRLRGVKILLVDETSMIPGALANDVIAVAARYDIRILALGDPFQLPPVNDSSKKENPLDVGIRTDCTLLTQTRTSEDSEILRTATALRSGTNIPVGHRGELYVTEDRGLIRTLADTYDNIQYLSYRNMTRYHTNNYVREAQWKQRGLTKVPSVPIAGDVITSMSTNHDTGVYMGEQYRLTSVEKHRRGEKTLIAYGTLVGSTDTTPRVLEMYHRDFGETVRLGKRPRGDGELREDYPEASSFDFGYCMTVHRSQGSEWPNVCLLNEYPHERNRLEGARWLYTGITRASQQLYMWGSHTDWR